MKQIIGNGFFISKKLIKRLPDIIKNRLVWIQLKDGSYICFDSMWYNTKYEDWVIGSVSCYLTGFNPIPFQNDYKYPTYDEVIVMIVWRDYE